MLAEDTKITLKVKFKKDGIARREEISEVVRELIEGGKGKRVRHKCTDDGSAVYPEQRQNGAVMLAEDTKITLKVKFKKDGIARREEISEVVRELIEGGKGKRVRHKVRELQEAGAKALEVEGRSYKALADVAKKRKEG
ncbi:uncharacterized protein A4U43_C01F26180 [Asparagus officinalis]|uniref:Uncharacterized protein n=1 Tax=Asparagus officinalis TaxID=4686 RepID=A0A5P1FWA6_ASPOF|nr:uncharacterized protein A4U43_C01F26180 [Asparagus officinalis]